MYQTMNAITLCYGKASGDFAAANLQLQKFEKIQQI